jgi:hypothetical protein
MYTQTENNKTLPYTFSLTGKLISAFYRGPSIDASYQVSVHLAEGFQRRRLKCEKLRTTDAK